MIKKSLIFVLCAVLACALCACGCEHEWAEASCLEARHCTLCDKSEGEPLGHDWHEADCDSPAGCSRCDLTEGEPLGHDWKEASCEEAKSCLRCGREEGEALGHDMQALACGAPMTCTVCGHEEGAPLDHLYGEWAPDNEVMSRSCARCENVETVEINRELIGTQWLLGSWTSTYMETSEGGLLFNGYSARFRADGNVNIWMEEDIEGTWEWDMHRSFDDGADCYDFICYVDNVGFWVTVVDEWGERYLFFLIEYVDDYLYVEFEKDETEQNEVLPGKIDFMI